MQPSPDDDFNPWPTIVGLGIAWLFGLVLIFRVFIPGLIMMQNDGALILAWLLPVGFAYGSYRLYRIIKEIIA